jgi:hypothetical protein
LVNIDRENDGAAKNQADVSLGVGFDQLQLLMFITHEKTFEHFVVIVGFRTFSNSR